MPSLKKIESIVNYPWHWKNQGIKAQNPFETHCTFNGIAQLSNVCINFALSLYVDMHKRLAE